MSDTGSIGPLVSDEFVIPKASSRAFRVEQGQHLRVIAHEGKQVADLRFLNAADPAEQFSSWLSISLNRIAGTGGTRRLQTLHSALPRQNLMATVVSDDAGRHQFYGQCIAAFYDKMGQPGHANCAELFEECLAPHGIGMANLDDTSVFNVFMPVRYLDDELGTYEFLGPSCEPGDAIVFRAEMDLLVAATSCPEETIVNDFDPKGMMYQILDPPG